MAGEIVGVPHTKFGGGRFITINFVGVIVPVDVLSFGHKLLLSSA